MQNSIGLLYCIAAFTHLAAVVLSKIEVTLQAYKPPSPLGSSRQPQSTQTIRLRSGRLAIAAFTIDKILVSTTDVTIGSIDSSSPGQCPENSQVLFSPTFFAAMSGSTQAMKRPNGLTRKSVQASQHTFIGEDRWPEVSSSLSSVCTHHQEEQRNHRGDGIHTNVHEFLPVSRGCFQPILPSAKANLRELIQCCLEFLTIEESLACHVPFPKRHFRHQMTDLRNATIDWEILSLVAGTLLVDDSHGLGNLPDALPHFVFYPLCCQATLLLPNPHGFCCPFISKMNFSHWKTPGVSERMWSVNLDASISGEYQTLGGHSCWPSE